MTALEKICSRCQVSQPASGFAIDKKAKDGRSGWCKDCRNAWGRANRHITRPVEYAYKIRRRYGLTIEQYADLLERQGNRCAICLTTDPKGHGGKTFHVDHDHVTGTVRGLLCAPCNSGIGHLGDSPERLRAALAYLERP